MNGTWYSTFSSVLEIHLIIHRPVSRLERTHDVRSERRQWVNLSSSVTRYTEVDLSSSVTRYTEVDLSSSVTCYTEVDLSSSVTRYTEVDSSSSVTRYTERVTTYCSVQHQSVVP